MSAAADWVRLVTEAGLAVLQAVRSGKAKTTTVWEILPNEWRDRARLRELEARARDDYQD